MRNRYQAKTTRTLIKTVRNSTDKKEASELFNKVASLLDKLAKKNVIHKNKAANQKSKLAKAIAKIGTVSEEKKAPAKKKAAAKTRAKKK